MRTVAVLCAAGNSAYKSLRGIDVFDKRRDARNFAGGMPIVAHPPCRSWSAYCGHQAKPEPGERELAIWCCDQLKRWGGCLNSPRIRAFSKPQGFRGREKRAAKGCSRSKFLRLGGATPCGSSRGFASLGSTSTAWLFLTDIMTRAAIAAGSKS
jgi:hypothetical protein